MGSGFFKYDSMREQVIHTLPKRPSSKNAQNMAAGDSTLRRPKGQELRWYLSIAMTVTLA